MSGGWYEAKQYAGRERFSKLTTSLRGFVAQQGFKLEDVNRLIKDYQAEKAKHLR